MARDEGNYRLGSGKREELLNGPQERELLQRIRTGDAKARDRIILANVGLVLKLAHHYKYSGLPLEDLIHEGYVGLIYAVDRFDDSEGNRLSTYATWWIRHYMRRAIASQTHALRLPLPVLQNLFQLQQMRENLRQELHCEPSTKDLAAAMKCSATKIQTLQQVSGQSLSLQESLSGEWDDELTLEDCLADPRQPTPIEHLLSKSLAHDLGEWMKKLSKREVEILQLRYGLTGKSPMTFEEIGRKCALTRERVRQIEVAALEKLRRFL